MTSQTTMSHHIPSKIVQVAPSRLECYHLARLLRLRARHRRTDLVVSRRRPLNSDFGPFRLCDGRRRATHGLAMLVNGRRNWWRSTSLRDTSLHIQVQCFDDEPLPRTLEPKVVFATPFRMARWGRKAAQDGQLLRGWHQRSDRRCPVNMNKAMICWKSRR